MRKLFFILAVVINLPAHAQENGQIRFHFNFANIGIGTNVPLHTSGTNGELFFTLTNFGFEHKRTNLGMEFSPYKAIGWFGSNEPSTTNDMIFSLLNLKLFWNAVSSYDGSFYLGLFSTINYIYVDERFYWNKYIFTAGLHSGLRASSNWIGYNIFSVETGFRVIEEKARFYAGFIIDIPVLVLLSIFLNSSSD